MLSEWRRYRALKAILQAPRSLKSIKNAVGPEPSLTARFKGWIYGDRSINTAARCPKENRVRLHAKTKHHRYIGNLLACNFGY